jgi:hypothetical protein
MSSLITQTKKSACTYNLKASSSVGWGGSIPCGAIEAYPNLDAPYDSVEFALAVESFQEDTYGSGSQVDGKMGRGTWSVLLKKFDHVDDTQPFWTLNDRRINVEIDGDVHTINFDQSGGLDLHRFGHFSSRNGRKPTFIVVHWGGLDPTHCHRIFSNPDRKVSSHAGIGLSPSGDPTIYQYLDLNHKSWHGGWSNSYSVGIDICQQPSLKWKDHYTKKGYNLSVEENTTGRGDKKVLTLDPRVALAVREAIKSLCDVLDIPYQCPRGVDGQSYEGDFYHGVMDKSYMTSSFTGVVGHHHITANKWDCACWWSQIWED